MPNEHGQSLRVVDAVMAAVTFPAEAHDHVQRILADLAILADASPQSPDEKVVRTRLKQSASALCDIAEGNPAVHQEAMDAVYYAATGNPVNAQDSAWNVVDPSVREEMVGRLRTRDD